MNSRNCFFTLTILLSTSIVSAQNVLSNLPSKNVQSDSIGGKKVTVITSNALVYGYRVQVFFGNDRKTAYFQQAKFKALYPELNAYVTYTQPNYRVKVGDFRTRTEAQQIIAKLRPDFPNLFIFNERINAIKSNESHVDQ